jgi:DnaJ-class molecular chaperone
MAVKDYYLILGVSRTASATGIREAFRELAKRYHPDRIGPQGTGGFQTIVEAYQVLSDPDRRRLYNQELSHAEEQPAPPPDPIIIRSEPAPEPLVPEPMSILRGFHSIYPSFEPLVHRFRRNFTGRGVPKAERVESLTVELLLSPAEALRGGAVPLGVPVFYPCPVCYGSGRDWLFPCLYCGEQGMVEDEEKVLVRVPPMVQDGAVMEFPLRGLGIHNLYLRLYIRIAA